MGLWGFPDESLEHHRLGLKILPSLARPCLLGMASLLLVVSPFWTPNAWARVVVLVESQASIYQQAARGFQQGFANVDEVEQILPSQRRPSGGRTIRGVAQESTAAGGCHRHSGRPFRQGTPSQHSNPLLSSPSSYPK